MMKELLIAALTALGATLILMLVGRCLFRESLSYGESIIILLIFFFSSYERPK